MIHSTILGYSRLSVWPLLVASSGGTPLNPISKTGYVIQYHDITLVISNKLLYNQLVFAFSAGISSLLLLGVLGLLPTLQCCIHLPTRTFHAHQRAVLGHVPSFIILPCPHGWRPPDGARSPHCICRDHLLDGRP